MPVADISNQDIDYAEQTRHYRPLKGFQQPRLPIIKKW